VIRFRQKGDSVTLIARSITVSLFLFAIAIPIFAGCRPIKPELSCENPPNQLNGEKPKKAFVFIHGWDGSDEKDTWGCLFPFLKKNFQRDNLRNYAIHAYRYPTSQFGHSPKIEDVSANFEAWLNQCCSSYDQLILVAHSMGGIVAKEYILNVLERGQADQLRVELVFFIATPHKGSDLAKWASYVPGLASPQLKTLGGVNKDLLNTQLSAWAAHVDGTDWRLHSSQKKYIRAIVLYGTKDEVVPEQSAKDRFPYCIPLFEDHSSIVKPENYPAQVVDLISEITESILLTGEQSKGIVVGQLNTGVVSGHPFSDLTVDTSFFVVDVGGYKRLYPPTVVLDFNQRNQPVFLKITNKTSSTSSFVMSDDQSFISKVSVRAGVVLRPGESAYIAIPTTILSHVTYGSFISVGYDSGAELIPVGRIYLLR